MAKTDSGSSAIKRWLIVDGGVKSVGGQDRANLELVRYLSRLGREVHVVAHDVDSDVFDLSGVSVHLVGRPLGSTFFGERALEATTGTLRSALGPGTLVVSNGGNYRFGHVVWVHSVHAAWPVRDKGAPLYHRSFNRFKKWDSRRREAAAFRNARLIIANSQKTERDLRESAAVLRDVIKVLYFGSDSATAKRDLRAGASQILFIGALGWDCNKGLDVALRAFALLLAHGNFSHRLVIAGAGSSAPWKRLAHKLRVSQWVDFLGIVTDIPALLARSDLLISPSRYEAYGLAVHEALAAGIPAIVSAGSGVAERFPYGLRSLRVDENENPQAWALAITTVLRHLETIRPSLDTFRHTTLKRTWAEMAREFVELVELRLGTGELV